eukprot:SAG31_NODE_850_length_11521_cov_47.558396_4_plen_81_part_00
MQIFWMHPSLKEKIEHYRWFLVLVPPGWRLGFGRGGHLHARGNDILNLVLHTISVSNTSSKRGCFLKSHFGPLTLRDLPM